ncbi:MAG: phosphatase PAP2 family protein [Bacteroidota bacterium]|nr:phosphatase PAP2 family protein [Bacteroidota bacterium]
MLKQLVLLLLLIPMTVCAQNIDIDLLKQINSTEAEPSDPFFKAISGTHVIVVSGVPLVLGVAGLIGKDEAMCVSALEVGAASAVNLAATYLLKYSVDRPRPFETYPNEILKKASGDGGSFPSGHTSSAFATATSLSLNYPKWYIIVPSYVWAGTVGYARMHQGVHYPSDVLAGALLGAGSAWLTHKVNKWLQTNKYQTNYGIHF